VKIRFTGLRQGEKLDETLFSDKEVRVPTEQARIFSTISHVDPSEFETLPERLSALYKAAKKNKDAKVRELLAGLLPDYTPAPSIVPKPRQESDGTTSDVEGDEGPGAERDPNTDFTVPYPDGF
jgi:hypothetical protein